MIIKMKRVILLLSALIAVACNPTTELNVMSFNIRYDNPDDAEIGYGWASRRDAAAAVVRANAIDIFGTQEVLSHQFADLKERLPEYEAVGVGREDGLSAGEHNAVFFLRERFELLDSGTFWLSETPEVAGSKGWDGACERIATWAVLRERKTKQEMLFINTHLDHVGKIARTEGVRLLMERLNAIRGERPVILTGDFNSVPQSPVIEQVSGYLQHTRNIAAEISGPAWSFTDFGEIPLDRRPLIDYIFVNEGVAVKSYAVLDETATGGFVSDHAPVKAVIEIKK